jgi:hypothetical protein
MINLELCMLTCSHAHQVAFHGHLRDVEAHLKTLRLTLEPWRLSLDPWRLTLDPWRLTVEHCILTQETWRLTLKPCMFTWGHSVLGSPWGQGCSSLTFRPIHFQLDLPKNLYFKYCLFINITHTFLINSTLQLTKPQAAVIHPVTPSL